MTSPTSQTSQTSTTPSTYWSATRTAAYGFWSALPLLLFYEAMILFVNVGSSTPVRVSADVWLKMPLRWAGASGEAAILIGAVLAGVFVFALRRNRDVPLKGRWFAGMLLESAVYAALLGVAASRIVAAVLAAAPDAIDVWTQLALSIGAGLYEELVFRVLLVGGLTWLLRRALTRPVAYLVAAVVGALIFSAIHYVGAYGDAWTLGSFAFRFVAGLLLNALFLLRGFGVAAWTHALYDVYFVLGTA